VSPVVGPADGEMLSITTLGFPLLRNSSSLVLVGGSLLSDFFSAYFSVSLAGSVNEAGL